MSCDTNLSNTNVFEIEVESVRVNKSYKKNMACRGNDSMVQFPYTDICAMDLEYALYATLNSTDVVAANVHSKCRLYLKNITEDVSSECSGNSTNVSLNHSLSKDH